MTTNHSLQIGRAKDLFEANRFVSAMTAHPCKNAGETSPRGPGGSALTAHASLAELWMCNANVPMSPPTTSMYPLHLQVAAVSPVTNLEYGSTPPDLTMATTAVRGGTHGLKRHNCYTTGFFSSYDGNPTAMVGLLL